MPHTFGEKMRALRRERELSLEEMAAILGTTKQVLSRYETNQRAPKITVVQDFAQKLNVPLSVLADNSVSFPLTVDGLEPLPTMQQLPLLGSIACGEPILAEENIEAYINVPEGVRADFVLRCKGDSMINARIHEGDVVFIRQQPDVENGEIAAVLIDGEATLKRVYHDNGTIILQAENTRYPPRSYSGPDLEGMRIIGKAVAFLSELK